MPVVPGSLWHELRAVGKPKRVRLTSERRHTSLEANRRRSQCSYYTKWETVNALRKLMRCQVEGQRLTCI